MKPVPYTFLFLNLLMVSSCTSNNEPKPPESSTADLDVLVKTHGYWEWESSVSMGSSLKPSTIGFTRQLVFKSDSLVHIYHNQQLFAQPRYDLSAGLLSRCGQPQITVPLVRYTAEAQLPNNDLRTYLIQASPTDTTLSITGEAACVDGGYYENYRWHHR